MLLATKNKENHNDHQERIVSEKTRLKLVKFHSFLLYLVIGSMWLYLTGKIFGGSIGLPEIINLGMIGQINTESASMILGAVAGAITAKLMNYR